MTTILGYMTTILLVAAASQVWKYGPQIMTQLHGWVKGGAMWIWNRRPRRQTLDRRIVQAMAHERFETWKARS